MKNNARIIIAGGGTGGHIFPAIAIAGALQKLSASTELLFIGAKGKMEMEKVPQAGYKIKGLEITGYNRSSLIKNLSLPYKLLKSFIEVRHIFRDFKPDAVIGVGGYSSFPVLRFAQGQGIPNYIHESNSFAGKTNILLGRRATRIFTATPGMEKFFPKEKITVTGNPVRASIAGGIPNREEGLRFFGLSSDRKVVLSIGGSLGAKSINEAIDRDLDKFGGLQLIWQTGKPYYEKARARTEGMKNVVVKDFISNMEMAYAAADLVISRSGAMAIAELAVVKKPVVFVPYPFAAEDHQTVNAKTLVNKDAAIMVSDSAALTRLVPEMIALSADEALQEKMKQNIGEFGVLHADTVIAQSIINDLNE